MTLAPYMGLDSIEPYAQYMRGKRQGRVCSVPHLKPPDAKDFEYELLADGRHVYDMVGDKLNAMGKAFFGRKRLLLAGACHWRHPHRRGQANSRALPRFVLPHSGLWRAGRHRAGHCPVSQAPATAAW